MWSLKKNHIFKWHVLTDKEKCSVCNIMWKSKKLYFWHIFGGPNISFWLNEHFIGEGGENLMSVQNSESIDVDGCLALAVKNQELEVN